LNMIHTLLSYRLLPIIIFFSALLGSANAQPPCQPESPELLCQDAPIVCSLNGFCARTPFNVPSNGIIQFCGVNNSNQNPNWISFIATDTIVIITVVPSNCNAQNGSGLNGVIVSECPPPPGIGVYQAVGRCQNFCTLSPFTLGNDGQFVVGQQYWLRIGTCVVTTICDFTLQVQGADVPSLENPNQISGPFLTCPGGTLTFEVDEPHLASTFYWTVDGQSITTTERKLQYTFPLSTPPGVYSVCLSNAENACFNLVDNNGYVPESICFEVTVVNTILTEAGPIDICKNDAPYVRDGLSFFPPDSQFEYTLSASSGCDSTVNLTVNWLYFPEDEQMVTCKSDFPIQHPIYGSIAGPGSYFLNYIDPVTQCDSSFNIIANEMIFLFNLDIPSYAIQCPGETIEIDASLSRVILQPSGMVVSNVTYEWYRDGEIVGNGSTISIREGGEYELKIYANENGVTCSDAFLFLIEEFLEEPMEPNINGPSSGCIGDTITFAISNWDGESEISFIHGACYKILNISGSELIVELTAACNDFFCVTFTKPNCPILSSFSCFSFRIFDQLKPNVSGATAFCQGLSTLLSADTGFVSYEWSGPNNFNSNERQITVTEAGEYTIRVTDTLGCNGLEIIRVIEHPNPLILFEGSTDFCPGSQTVITADPGNYVSYTWSNGSNTAQVTINIPGIYTLTVIDTSGCINSASIEITERDSLAPVIEGRLDFCEGQSAILDGSAGFVEYIWNGESGSQKLEVRVPGLVTLRVSDGLGCFGSTSVFVVQNENPLVQVDADKIRICPKEDLELRIHPIGMLSYDWSDGFTGRIRTISQTFIGEVTVTDSNGCVGVGQIDIDEHIPPSPQIQGDVFFCEGLQGLIGVTENYTGYSWSDGNSQQNRHVGVAGTYGVTVTDMNGCTGVTSFDVEERMNPRPVINGTTAFCDGDSTILTLTESYSSYIWSGSGSGTSPVYLVTVSGNYIVEVTDASGCIGSTNFQVTVHPNPVVTIGGSTTYCVGLSTTLDGGLFSSYSWSGPNGFTSMNKTITIRTVGEYSLIVTDENGCTGTSSVEVIEDTELRISVINPGAYCEGETAYISVFGDFASYLWNTGEITQGIDVTAGLYSVTVTDAEGCSGTQFVTVIENSNPDPVITGPSIFCTGRNALLDAGNWTSYEWDSGQGNGRVIGVSSTGLYAVTVTDENGCTGSTSFFIREIEQLNPRIDGDPMFCVGDSTTLIVEGGYISYQWLDNNSTNPERVFTRSGIYVIRVEDSQGCSGTNSVSVIENDLPIADAGPDLKLTCKENILQVGTENTSTGGFRYEWSELENGVNIINPTSRIISIVEPGLYKLLVINIATGCSLRDSIRVTRDENFIRDLKLEVLNPKCHNDRNGWIRVQEVLGGSAPFSFQLNSIPMPSSIAERLGPGQYTIRVEDSNGCIFEMVRILTNPAQIMVDAGPDLLLEFGEEMELIPVTNVPLDQLANIRWETENLVICDGCPELALRYEPDLTGVFRITIEDSFGCVASDFMRISLRRTRNIFIPSAFTPDNNGLNDRFTVYGGRDVVIVKSLRVFDRWGNQMFLAEDFPPNNTEYGWDGSFRGRSMDPATFVYIVEVVFSDGEVITKQGAITLIR
jgi:gliding motility-associated-like protein